MYKLIWAVILLSFCNFSFGAVATKAKTGKYISEGVITGGAKELRSVVLKDIRRAQSKDGFERVVFDLGSEQGQTNSLPYYQVQMSAKQNKVVLSFWADVSYRYSAEKVKSTFKKSKHVKVLNVVPRVEDGLSIIELFLVGTSKVEAFELSNPSRVILDLK
ncbi:MAG: hypothetical protein AB7F43_01060 [Bacteriovoracia bacterium]